MKLERAISEVLFNDIDPQNIINHIMSNKFGVKSTFVDFPAFYRSSLERFKVSSMDEIEKIYYGLDEQIDFNDPRTFFRYLGKFMSTVLDYDGYEPKVKYEMLMRWNKISHILGQDLLTMTFLAYRDFKYKDWTEFFSYKAVISTNNRQLHNIFKKAGLEIDGIVPTTLAERNLVLDKNELHDNVMILDIGAGNTDIGVFEGSSFIYTNSIPVGGDNITNDIAVVLNISEEEADKLKRQYGLALKSYIDNDNDIILNTSKDDNKNRIIKSSELIEIIEARIEEIFSIINKDITNQGIKSKINNVVLTGQGIVNISKSDVAGKINLNIPVKISTGRAISTVKSTYRTSYALVRYIAARPFAKTVSSSIDTQSNESFIKTILERIKEFFYS